MINGKRVISENLNMMVSMQDVWKQNLGQDILVIHAINSYLQIKTN